MNIIIKYELGMIYASEISVKAIIAYRCLFQPTDIQIILSLML